MLLKGLRVKTLTDRRERRVRGEGDRGDKGDEKKIGRGVGKEAGVDGAYGLRDL